MRQKIFLGLALALLVGYGFATNQAAVYTFECITNPENDGGTYPDGGRPGVLIPGSDGNFYGAAEDSMEGSSTPTGGTVFSVTPSGKFTLLHTFPPGAGNNYPDGNLPGLMGEGPDGKLYGETLFGAIGGCNGYCGYGLLYRIDRDGSNFEILHEYCSEANCADGQGGGTPVVGTDGNVYGTTYGGGANGAGTLFKVIPSSGAYEVVFNFDIKTSGEEPSGLVVGSDGTFYGLTENDEGEVLFHYVEATGEMHTVVVDFPSVNGLPSRGGFLTLGPKGNFYGLYSIYGESGVGLFEVEPDGSHLKLFAFFNTIDGGGAPQGLLLASDGNFWITNYNGSDGYGDITVVSPSTGKVIETLSPFSATSAIGAYPAELIQAPNGVLWGSTYQGGNTTKGHFSDGTVFSLNAGLPPR